MDMTNVKWYHRHMSVQGCVVRFRLRNASAFLPLNFVDSCIKIRLKRKAIKLTYYSSRDASIIPAFCNACRRWILVVLILF